MGQFNPTAEITAVSIGSQIMHMITVMIVGLAMGTTVTIGQDALSLTCRFLHVRTCPHELLQAEEKNAVEAIAL